MLFDQSERGHSVGTMFDQSEHGYSVRHRVYVRFSTNQSTAIAYVTGCTYAFRPVSARRSRILISVAPCGGLRNLAQPHATSRSLKKKARSAPILPLIKLVTNVSFNACGILVLVEIYLSGSNFILKNVINKLQSSEQHRRLVQ